MEPLAYIWVRKTVDWSDEQTFFAQIPEGFEPKLARWNETFETPFHSFRQRVAEIARLNHSRVSRAAVAKWDRIPDGALVLPVDDDDWFAPEVAVRAAEAQELGGAGARWPTIHVEDPMGFGHRVDLWRRRLLPFSPPRWICSTNNYALVKEAGSANKELLASHVEASRWVKAGRRDSMRSLPERLSIANRTIASRTSLGHLRPTVSRAELLRKSRRYRSIYREDVAGCPWACPHLEAMAELMDELQPRR